MEIPNNPNPIIKVFCYELSQYHVAANEKWALFKIIWYNAQKLGLVFIERPINGAIKLAMEIPNNPNPIIKVTKAKIIYSKFEAIISISCSSK